MGFSHVSCFVLPGWRCICREWHSELLIVHHHGQLSLPGACSCSKLPIAPMGTLLTRFSHSRLHNCEHFGQLQDVRAAETLQSSHRPDGIFTCFALVLAGRWCLGLEWHSELLIVHHHGQLSSPCACSCSKLPIAPMGKMLTRLLRLSLCTTANDASVNYRRCVLKRPQKFPSPRWENCSRACFDSRLRNCD